jgi:hypothetical protein
MSDAESAAHTGLSSSAPSSVRSASPVLMRTDLGTKSGTAMEARTGSRTAGVSHPSGSASEKLDAYSAVACTMKSKWTGSAGSNTAGVGTRFVPDQNLTPVSLST